MTFSNSINFEGNRGNIGSEVGTEERKVPRETRRRAPRGTGAGAAMRAPMWAVGWAVGWALGWRPPNLGRDWARLGKTALGIIRPKIVLWVKNRFSFERVVSIFWFRWLFCFREMCPSKRSSLPDYLGRDFATTLKATVCGFRFFPK